MKINIILIALLCLLNISCKELDEAMARSQSAPNPDSHDCYAIDEPQSMTLVSQELVNVQNIVQNKFYSISINNQIIFDECQKKTDHYYYSEKTSDNKLNIYTNQILNNLDIAFVQIESKEYCLEDNSNIEFSDEVNLITLTPSCSTEVSKQIIINLQSTN